MKRDSAKEKAKLDRENAAEQQRQQEEERRQARRMRAEKKEKKKKGKIGWDSADVDGWMQDSDNESASSSLFRRSTDKTYGARKASGKSRTRGRGIVSHHYLNCGVPDSVRSDLKRRGVRLPKGTSEVDGVNMNTQLRRTKKTYNQLWEDAYTREDSRNCGSFADLTLPGSDRARRLQRLSRKNGFR